VSKDGRESRRAVGQSRLPDPVVIVFDGDDTLWTTEPLYDDARSAARAVVAAAGLDGGQWEVLERAIDVANVATLGYSPKRFPTSCLQAYEDLCAREERTPEAAVASQIRRAATTVFKREPVVVDNARGTLEFLRRRGIRLALLTKGDLRVQTQRIEGSGLRPMFAAVRIVSEKSPAIIRSTVAALGAEPSEAWMVGNSIKSDVIPALQAGLTVVWIEAHVWEHERVPEHGLDDRVIALHALADIRNLLNP